jgi:hypothetical protein
MAATGRWIRCITRELKGQPLILHRWAVQDDSDCVSGNTEQASYTLIRFAEDQILDTQKWAATE